MMDTDTLFINWDWWLDGWIIATAILCSVAAAILGNFLVLRRMSLIGDAISHSVLPGLAAAYLMTGSRHSLPMFLGAVAVGLLSVWLTEAIGSIGKVDEGASTGVVFTGLFALGVILIVQAADKVDLDPNCILYGDIELTPLDLIATPLGDIPRCALILGGVLLLNIVFVITFWKPLRITTFDPQLADSLGIHSRFMHYSIAGLVAVTSVSSFEAVGNVLVVTMFIVPPTIAFLLVKRLEPMVIVSAVVAAICAFLGHILSVFVPRTVGIGSTSTSAMISVVAGLLLVAAVLFNWRSGVLINVLRQGRSSFKILSQDIIALLFRDAEQSRPSKSIRDIQRSLLATYFNTWLTISYLRYRGWVVRLTDGFGLTELGKKQAQKVVRSHRLWEQYLATTIGVSPSRLHQQAESLEHFTNLELREQLDSETKRPSQDPHGRDIPPEIKP